MKQVCGYVIASFIAVVFLPGCGPSDEQVNKVVKVGTEIAEVQRQYYPAITELGRVSVQIEALAQRQDPTTKAMANEVAGAHELILSAFTACQKAQDSVVVGMPKGMSLEKYVLAQENERNLLLDALAKTKAAVSKAHEVLDALSAAKTGKAVGKK